MRVSCFLSYCTSITITICFINIFIAMHSYSSCISFFHISKFGRISSVAFVDPQYFRDIPRQLKNVITTLCLLVYIQVCLSRCLFATLQKTYTQILMAMSVYVGYDLRNITKMMDAFWIWIRHFILFLCQRGWG